MTVEQYLIHFQFQPRFQFDHIVCIVFQTDGSPDPHLYIWDVDTHRMEFFNFESGRGEQDELYADETQEEDASALDK